MSNDDETNYSKLSPEQRERYFGEERNRRRREKYQQDVDYREQRRIQNQKYYAEKRKANKESKGVEPKRVSNYAKTIKAYDTEQDGYVGELEVINKNDFSFIFGVSRPTLGNWFNKGCIPEPSYAEVTNTDKMTRNEFVKFYSLDETIAMLERYLLHVSTTSSHLSDRYPDVLEDLQKIHINDRRKVI